MKTLRKMVSLLLVLCMVLSMTLTCAFADTESGNTITLSVSTAEELQTYFQSTDYGDYDEVILQLTGNIQMTTETLITSMGPSAVTIDGQGYTLAAPEGETAGEYYMFDLPGLSSQAITFQNLTIDGNQNPFFRNYGGGTYKAAKDTSLTLNGVTLKNLYGSGSTGYDYGICFRGVYSGGAVTCSVTIENTVTENCAGALMTFCRTDLTVSNSTLSTSALEGVEGAVLDLSANGNTNYSCVAAVTNSTLTWTDETSSQYMYGLYGGNYWTVTVSGGTSILGAETAVPTENYSGARYAYAAVAVAQYGTVVLNDCTVANTDGSDAYIFLDSESSTFQTNGAMQGSPMVLMPSGASIQLSNSLEYDLQFSFYYSSYNSGTTRVSTGRSYISGSDPTVAIGENYTLTSSDLEHLIYEESSPRVLTLTENTAVLSRVTLTEDMVDLLYPDATAEDGTYVYYATYDAGSVSPDVQILTSGGAVADSANYTVVYANNTLPSDAVAGDTITATVTVTGKYDFSGGTVKKTFQISVLEFLDLSAEDAPVSATVTYNGSEYSVEITYNGETLVESEDYNVTYQVDTVKYVTTAVITGTGTYGGTIVLEVPILGQETMVAYVSDEETLNTAINNQVENIYFLNDIAVDEPVEVDYDVTIHGEGYTLGAGGLESYILTGSSSVNTAVLSIQDNVSVTLDNLTVDGEEQARLLYVADGAYVEITDTSVLTNGGCTGSTENGLALYVDEGAEVTLLGTVKDTDSSGTNAPIYILGTLNIKKGAYLTNLTSKSSAICNQGELNWSGGTFDVNTTSGYTNSIYGSLTAGGAVIANGGTFNMSGSALLNGWLLDSDGEYTTTRSTASFGAVLNYTGATFNLSEDATIQGFDAAGTAASQLNYPIAGGGVHNVGTFNMTGGSITGNASTGGSADGSGMNGESAGKGGGVYNAGVFNMYGGEISNNTAGNGGGVYNDGEHNVASGDSNIVSAGEFYMTGGTISGNTVDNDISISSSTSMGQSNGTNAYGVGSAIYVAGSSTVVISGGSITTDQTAELIITAEDGTQTTQTPSVGIAVVPTASYRAGASGSSFTAASASSSWLTITGDPEISVGILLIHISTVAKSAQLDLTTYDSTGEIAYTSATETSRTGDTDGMAYLVLDGNLDGGVELDMYVLSADATTISFNNVSATGGSYPTSTSTTEYSYNYDGALLSIYNEGVAASENDGAHFNISEGALYLTTTTITDENGNNVIRDAWAFCGHSEELEYVEAVAATCTTDGCIGHYVCPTCGTYFADGAGETALTEEDVILSATGHDEDLAYVRAVAATCGEGGHIAYYQCASCGAMFDGPDADLANELTETDILLSATGEHTWNNGEVTTKATCTETGVVTYTCTVCGETYSETIAATGHTWGAAVTENEVAATETEAGSYDLVYYCTDCGVELARTTVTGTGSGTAHTWDEGTVTVPATRYTKGIITFTCTDEDCEETYTTYTNKINYTFLFDDVLNDSRYYFIPVYWAYDLGITSGTSTNLFSPSQGCTRAQFVTFLCRLAQANGVDTSTGDTSSNFTDVSSSAYYYEAVLWAYDLGITSGTSDTTFTPNRTITRREAITMLYRYECAVNETPTVETENPFSDVTTSDYAYTAILWADATNVTSGTSETTFSPANTCTRAMMVTFLYNYAAIQD